MCVACAALCARSRCFICLSNEPTQHFLTHPLPFPLSRLPLSCHPGQLSVVIYVPSLSRRPRIQMRLCPEAKKNCPSEPICSRCAAIVLNARPPGLSPRRVWLLLAPAPRNPEAGTHGLALTTTGQTTAKAVRLRGRCWFGVRRSGLAGVRRAGVRKEKKKADAVVGG